MQDKVGLGLALVCFVAAMFDVFGHGRSEAERERAACARGKKPSSPWRWLAAATEDRAIDAAARCIGPADANR